MLHMYIVALANSNNMDMVSSQRLDSGRSNVNHLAAHILSKFKVVKIMELMHNRFIGGGSNTASTATAIAKFDKWGLSRTKVGSEQF